MKVVTTSEGHRRLHSDVILEPLVAAVVLSLASWTLAVHAAGILGFSFNLLYGLVPVALGLAVLVWFIWRRSPAVPVVEQSSQGSLLAPEAVASWVATMEGRPRLLIVRGHYLLFLSDYVGGEEVARRMGLQQAVSGFSHHPANPKLLREAIGRDGLTHVVLSSGADPALSDILSNEGFGDHSMDGYTLWQRSIGPE